MSDAPPPGSPAEARAILIAMLNEVRTATVEVRALNKALAVHAGILEKHEAMLQQLLMLAATRQGASVLDQVAGIFGFGEDEDDEPPAKRKRR